MNLEIPPFLIYLASWLGFMGGVWGIFDHAEKVVNPKVRRTITDWLKKLEIPTSQRWPNAFSHLFGQVFGKKHLSFVCFLRSSLASLIFVAIFFTLWIAVRPSEFASLADQDWAVLLFGPVLFGVFFNIFPDYISLLETRWVLLWMARCKSMLSIVFFLVVDLLMTTVIVTFTFILVFYLLGNRSLVEIYNHFLTALLLRAREGYMSLGIYVYSTYLTSIWIWLYSISGAIVRITKTSHLTLRYSKKFFDIDGQPIRSLGFVSMILITVLYITIPLLRLICLGATAGQ